MKKIVPMLGLALGGFLGGKAQTYPLVTIQDIQTAVAPGTCNDSSALYHDTVRVRGVVLMDGGLAQAAGGRNIWIQAGGFGLDVFGYSATATTPDDILDLVSGDSIEITGFVDEFQGETEIRPLQSGTSLTLLGSGVYPAAQVVNIGDLNDNGQLNQITTGEIYEGKFVEIQNATVTAVTYFSGNTRVSFVVQDGSGNVINVSDRFIVQRLPNLGGTFVPPNVGDQFCSLKGILMHSKNNCPGFSGRGYELHPFDTSHYQICSAAPAIFNVSRNPITPTSSQSVTVSAEITDGDGVASASLYYAVGVGTVSYTQVAMSNISGNTWTGVIPAQSNGSFVKYYVGATDNNGMTSYNTTVPSGSNPYFYTVRDNGTQIFDVQYVPSSFNTGGSGYVDLDVTVEGVVTASAEPGNLGYVFIQQEGQIAYAGIMLTGNASLASLTVGQKVQVTGTVKEYFGFTRLENVSQVSVIGTGSISPIQLDPALFTTYDLATNEQYESMLIRLENPSSGPMYVVDANADDPSNFAEYRVGNDQFDPATGCRALAGRQTSSSFSSLNVSWVNDSTWATTDGAMNVPVCVVTEGQQFDSLVGIMMYSFSNFKILPRNNADVGATPCFTAVNPHLGAGFVQAYPNPTMGTLKIGYQLEEANTEAVVYDLMGRTVAAKYLNGTEGEAQFDLTSVPNGTYLLHVRSANHLLYSQKVIVNR